MVKHSQVNPLKQSRVWAAKREYANADKAQKDLYKKLWGKPTYSLTTYERNEVAKVDYNKSVAKRNLKNEQKRAKDYAIAKANWKKLLKTTRA